MKIVIDANITLALVLPLPYSDAAEVKMRECQNLDIDIFVPTLWHYETVSALRKAVVLNIISHKEASEAIQYICSLGISEYHPTHYLQQKSLEWAKKLNQTVAYDASYLALAEHIKSELWTADEKFVKSAKNAGIIWVKSIKE